MRTIEIKNINGVVLFSHTAENNSIKLTVEEAVKKNVCLTLADLGDAELAGANLKGAIFRGANLGGANLRDTNLEKADLAWANLAWATLERADLNFAFLKCADLTGADISWAFLEGADLTEADITGAKIHGADLKGAKNIPFIPLACPSEGAFTGWKKVYGYFLIKLQIPEDARRTSATARKCRCDKAIVLDITSLDGEEHYDEVTNKRHNETIYKVGEFVYPDSFDENRWNECSNGIHFFVNKQDAINY